MADLRYNLVTFLADGESSQRMYLTLESDWVMTAGIEPNINQATMPASEFAKMTGSFGRIEFWYQTHPDDEGATPDHAIQGVELVDWQPERFGQTPGSNAETVVVWRLSFADARQVLRDDGNGRLFAGRINPDPAPPGYTLKTNQELIEACLDACGLTGTIAATVDDVEPLREVAWDGVSAASALRELLDHTGHVITLASTGLLQVWKPGSGVIGTLPSGRIARQITTPAASRLPTQILMISAPEAEIDTWSEQPTSGVPAWSYVVRDEDGVWRPIADVVTDPVDAFNLGTMPPEIAKQAYRCIQVDTTKYPPGRVSILTEAVDRFGETREPYMRLASGKVATQLDNKRWANNTAAVVLKVEEIVAEANVLVFDQPLGKLAGRSAAPTLRPFFEPIAPADLKPTYSIESFDTVAGEKRPSVFGFTASSLAASPVSESTARSWLKGSRPSVRCYCLPDLQAVVENRGTAEQESNRTTIEARAESQAAAIAAGGSDATTQIVVVGFAAIDLGARVTEIRWNQERCSTTLIADNWGVAGRPAMLTGGRRVPATAGRSSVAYSATRTRDAAERRSVTRQSRRGTGGRAATVQRTSIARPEPAAETIVVEIVGAIAGQLGRYNGKSIAGDIGGASGNLAKADLGTAAPANDVIVWCLPDIGGSTPVLEDGQVVTGLRVGASSSGVPIIVVSGAGAGGGSELPTPSARYQVLSVTAYTSSSVYTVGWDYVRAHA